MSAPIPSLFLKRGRRLAQVTAPQASELMDALRASHHDRVREIPLHNADGEQIGHVSFNGRVWIGDTEIPLPGVKTAAQHEAEGWSDYKQQGVRNV